MSNQLTISDNGVNFIKQHEGFCAKAYADCGGILTIGYGHTQGVVAGQVITEEQGESLLRSDLQTAERAVNSYVRIALNQNQYDALVSFVFNVGTGNFKFSTLLKYLNVGNVRAAADELDRWNKVKGQPVAGLTKRRAQEKALFLEG